MRNKVAGWEERVEMTFETKPNTSMHSDTYIITPTYLTAPVSFVARARYRRYKEACPTRVHAFCESKHSRQFNARPQRPYIIRRSFRTWRTCATDGIKRAHTRNFLRSSLVLGGRPPVRCSYGNNQLSFVSRRSPHHERMVDDHATVHVSQHPSREPSIPS